MSQERKTITALLGKRIRKVEFVSGSGGLYYYRFWYSKKLFFDVSENDMFDEKGMRFVEPEYRP